jgi:hypothetical protein
MMMKTIAKHFIPNAGTLIILGLFLWANAVGAFPFNATASQAPAIPAVVNYQGKLTDADGNARTGTYSMTFTIYSDESGSNPVWSETHSVQVIDGLFNVLLGRDTALTPSTLNGDRWLGVQVETDPEMRPLEPLVSVPYALLANVTDGSITTAKIADGAVTGTKIANGAVTEAKLANDAVTTSKIQDGQVGNADLANSVVNSAKIQDGQVQNADLANGSVTPDKLDRSYVSQNGGTINGNLSVNGEVTVNRLNSPNGADLVIDANNPGYGTLTLHDTVRIPDGALDMGGNRIDNATRLSSPGASDLVIDSGAGTSRTLTLHDAVRIPDGDLDMVGHRILNVGAMIEANLQTPEEVTAERIERFELGDVLCWAGKRLERCALANDRLVVAVADENGKPIVIGAEPVKVVGPVRMGDLLVASDVAGYAMVNNQPAAGTVIAKALEAFDGEKGVVKAMIRTP